MNQHEQDSSTTTKEALEPCPLAHPIVNGVRFTNFSNNVKAHIWCYDCGLEFEGRVNEPRDKVAERWNSRVSAPIVAPVVDDDLRKLLESYAEPCVGDCDHSQCPLLRELHALRIKATLERARLSVKPIVDTEKQGEQIGELMNMRLDATASATAEHEKVAREIVAGCSNWSDIQYRIIPRIVAHLRTVPASPAALRDEAQTGSSVFLQIPTCGRCPFVDHSGSFTPGGAKTICNHRDAVETFAANVAGEDRYHWKYRQVNHGAAPPEQCPLRRKRNER